MMLLSPGAAALVASPALRLSRCALSSLSASAAADPGYKAKQSDPGYKAKQSLGQNFLQDEAAARKLVGCLQDESEGGSRVVELGPGKGALTRPLLAAYPQMTGVEIDERSVKLLREELPSLRLLQGDMLALDLAAMAAERGGALSVISNTPFYLTSPLLFRLLASGDAVGRAVLTMQKEVGEKVLAPHGCKQYGILSVMLQLFAQPEAVFDIPPAAFRPMPKCTVSVLRFAPTAAPGGGAGAAWSATQREQLLALLKRTFEQRRKMLRQTLKPLLADAATPIPDDWLTKRPEQLSPLEWVELSSMVFGDSADGGDASLLRKDMQPKWSATKAGWKDNKLRPNRPAPAPE